MSSFLKNVGIFNAAIWFGSSLFFVFVLGGVFSSDTRQLFHDQAYLYYAGGIAEILFKRYFAVQYVCGLVAILHLVAEKLYLGRPWPRLGLALVIVLLLIGLVGGLWLQPHLEALRSVMYLGRSVPLREQAHSSFDLWHAISEIVSVLVLIGLAANLFRVSRLKESGRYGTFY